MHPWRLLREMSHLDLRWHDEGPRGLTDHRTWISLRRDLNHAERRCTVMHEIIHCQRGPVPEGLAEREEQIVRQISARMMLPDVRLIADALAWTGQQLHETADELAVDVPTLTDRLAHLHPAERHWITRRLAWA